MGKIIKRLLQLIIFGALVASAVFAVLHFQDIRDWLTLRDYQPSSRIVMLADETTMTATARRYFYVSRPSIEDATTFNQSCRASQEKTIVLGCYRPGPRTIHIFSISDDRLNGIEEVTAAHEMLHVAYERLDSRDKQRLASMIDAQVERVRDEHLDDLIALYQKREPGQYYNELHSILGTEYGNLDQSLENHYAKYFSNRQVVVDYSKGYQKIFNSMKNQLDQNETLLRNLKQQIDSSEARVKSLRTRIDTELNELNQIRQTNPELYNSRVGQYNQLVDQYNDVVSQYKSEIDNYNKIVREHNSVAIDFNQLTNELDSTYQPITDE